MIKARPSQVFDFGTEEQIEDGQKPSDPLPSPTLDDRANLYLNAVYGAREFKSDEYASARNIILHEMAVQTAQSIGTKVEHEPVYIAPTHPSQQAPTTAASVLEERLVIQRDQALRDEASASIIRPRMSMASAPSFQPSTPYDFQPSDLDSELNLEAVDRAPDFFSSRKPSSPRRRSMIRLALIVPSLTLVAVGTLSAILLISELRAPRMGMVSPFSTADRQDKSIEMQTEARAPQMGMTDQPGDSQDKIAKMQSQALRLENSELIRRLVRLGNKLLADGDVNAGQLVLIQAADGGSASAALTLGAIFDPTETTVQLIGYGLQDPVKARDWYARAKALGSEQAQARLDRLAKYKP